MADATYQPKVYRRQGGNVFVVASTGQVLVESGGGIEVDSGGRIGLDATMTVASGGIITVASGGLIDVADGGQITVPVATETTAADLSNFGISVVTQGTTATGANTYTIAAPAVGTLKWLSATAANTSEHILIRASSNVTFDPAGSKDLLKIVAPGGIGLIGITTSAYQLLVASTIVAFATSS